VLCFAAVVGVAVCALLVAVLVVRGVVEASLWAGVLAALAGVVATGAALWPLMARSSRVPPELKVPDWVVDRPAEMAVLVTAVTKGRGGAVGITTGLSGAGGSVRRPWSRWCVRTVEYGAGLEGGSIW